MSALFYTFDNNKADLHESSLGISDKKRLSVLDRMRRQIRGTRPQMYRGGGSHFTFEYNSSRFVYVYIRKNGCTSFKRFLSYINTNQHESELAIQSLQKQCSVSWQWQINRAQEVIAVVRDPVDRVCSLFRNKFIQCDGARDIQVNFERLCNIEPSHATFKNFVEDYLSILVLSNDRGSSLDPHCHAQVEHFWPIRYTRVFPIEHLGENAIQLFGEDAGAEFFQQRANTSTKNLFDTDASEVLSIDFRKHYERTGELPSNTSLLNDNLRQCIERIYFDDFLFLRFLGYSETL